MHHVILLMAINDTALINVISLSFYQVHIYNF